MKDKFVKYFMDVAERTAQLSYAERLKVGTVIVKNNRIISCGYNGLPSGWEPNTCEYETIISDEKYQTLSDLEKTRFILSNTFYNNGNGYYDSKVEWKGLKTYDEVIHSEANAISQLASSTESGIGAILICTHSPCLQCSKIIYSSGIQTVYYKNEYRSDEGILFLKKCGVDVIKYEEK
jgi:dCMP deaminase